MVPPPSEQSDSVNDNHNEPEYEVREGNTIVTYRVDRLLQQRSANHLEQFLVWLPDLERSEKLLIKAVIFAAEIHPPIEETLKVDLNFL